MFGSASAKGIRFDQGFNSLQGMCERTVGATRDHEGLLGGKGKLL
jgi:hypothetical protein